jgi:hypothetical protein
MIAQPIYHFPEQYRKIAEALYDILKECAELQNAPLPRSLLLRPRDRSVTIRTRSAMQGGSGESSGAAFTEVEHAQRGPRTRGRAKKDTEAVTDEKNEDKKSTSKSSPTKRSAASQSPASEEEDDDEDEDEEDTPKPKRARRRVRTAGATDIKEIKAALDDHPIFGLNGIMHHMILGTGEKHHLRINPDYMPFKKSAKVFGHNGLQIGQCWPYQLTVLRDGGHGSSQGGIAGDPEQGAWSIVVGSKIYEDVDEDSGDGIWYSAPWGNDTKKEKADRDNKGAKCLFRSIETNEPVRVFRKAEGKAKDAPRMGLRYDGLYKVVKATEGKNAKGGIFAKFFLVRAKGQAPIDVNKPTAAQMAEYAKIKDGY